MKQPELGKKISELRKAKGLTQEELVEKCNIESTPKSLKVDFQLPSNLLLFGVDSILELELSKE
jgi:transcriptional regulator with XRE-family HTH domain